MGWNVRLVIPNNVMMGVEERKNVEAGSLNQLKEGLGEDIEDAGDKKEEEEEGHLGEREEAREELDDCKGTSHGGTGEKHTREVKKEEQACQDAVETLDKPVDKPCTNPVNVVNQVDATLTAPKKASQHT